MADLLYHFGAYRFDPLKGLFRGEKQIPLPPKEFQLLELLLSLEGRVASRSVIEAALWPRQVISYASLARCAYSLRKHLDIADEAYIQTVPRRGYRMAAPIKKEVLVSSTSAAAVSAVTAPLAYAHYLQGLREANNPDPDSLERAIHWYGEAIKVAPDYATALAAIADIRVWQVIRGYLVPMQGFKLALSQSERALQIDHFFAPAAATRALLVGILEAAPRKALALLDEALVHDPNYARGHTYRALLLRMLGRTEEVLEANRQAVELDPHSVLNRHSLAWSLFCTGHAEEALALERNIGHSYPTDDIAYAYIALFALHLERSDEALDSTFEALQISKGNPAIQAIASYILATVGETGEAIDLLHQAESAKLPRAPKVFLAAAHLALGDREHSLRTLVEAREEHCIWLPWSRMDPRFAPLTDEPRFRSLFN